MVTKDVYKIGTKQYFTYKNIIFKKFRKFLKLEEYWVVRNVKYIYASSIEEAKEKYEKWFFKEYKKIIKGWGDWYCESDGVDIFMDEDKINITSTIIVSIDNDKDIDVNLETLKANMQAENFREWWFDGEIVI